MSAIATSLQSMARIRFVWIVLWSRRCLLWRGIVLLGGLGEQRFSVLVSRVVSECMGFTLMALEVLLLLGFQAIYGYVYQQLAVLVAAVMMGMALGSWLGLRRISRTRQELDPVTLRAVAALQVAAAVSPLLLYGFLLACAQSSSLIALLVVGDVLFPLAGVLCGMLGGYQFPLASRLFFADGKMRGRTAECCTVSIFWERASAQSC